MSTIVGSTPVAELHLVLTDCTWLPTRIEAHGQVTFSGARVGGQMILDDCVLHNPAGIALRMIRTTVQHDCALRLRSPCAGRVILRGATVDTLHDDLNIWASSYELAGFRYGGLVGPDQQALRRRPWDREPECTVRLQWLRGATDGHVAQLYDELARQYASAGHETARRRVLIRKQRRRRDGLRLGGRTWGYVQEYLVGYGYSAWRAVIPFALLIGFGWWFFASHRHEFTPTDPLDAAPHFSALLYTIDVLLPVVSLGQRTAYTTIGMVSTVSAVLTIFGWILTTAIVAALAGFVARSD